MWYIALAPVPNSLDGGHSDMGGLILNRIYHNLDAIRNNHCFDLDHVRTVHLLLYETVRWESRGPPSLSVFFS